MKYSVTLLLALFMLLIPFSGIAISASQDTLAPQLTTVNSGNPYESSKLKSTGDLKARKMRRQSRRALIMGILGMFVPPLAVGGLLVGRKIKEKASAYEGKYYYRTKRQAAAGRMFGRISLIVLFSAGLGILILVGITYKITSNF